MDKIGELLAASLCNIGLNAVYANGRITIDGDVHFYVQGAPNKPRYVRVEYRRFATSQAGLTKAVIHILAMLGTYRRAAMERREAHNIQAIVENLNRQLPDCIRVRTYNGAFELSVTHPDLQVIDELVRRVCQLVVIDESSPEAACTCADELEEMGFAAWANRIRAKYKL